MLGELKITSDELVGKSPGRKIDVLEFGRHPQLYLMEVDKEIEEQTFRPAYSSFIKQNPRPREIVHPKKFGQRVVSGWVGKRIRPLVEGSLTDRSYSGRRGCGPLNAVERFREDMYEVSNGYTGKAWIIRTDIRNCFPSADREKICKRILELIERGYKKDDKERLEELVRILYLDLGDEIEPECDESDYDDVPEEKKIRGRKGFKGAPIGDVLFHLGVEALLADVDRWLDDRGVRFVRYLDDIIMVTDRKDYALSLFPELRRRLNLLGFSSVEIKRAKSH